MFTMSAQHARGEGDLTLQSVPDVERGWFGAVLPGGQRQIGLQCNEGSHHCGPSIKAGEGPFNSFLVAAGHVD